jgi:putative oxidoreductase
MENDTRSKVSDLALLALRIGLGILFLRAGWMKVTHIGSVVMLWQRLHLPLPGVFGPIHAVVEFGGGILLLVGWLTPLAGTLIAIDMLGALLLVKIHTPTFINQEWLAFWMSLALAMTGAGTLSFDAYLRGRAAGSSSKAAPRAARAG